MTLGRVAVVSHDGERNPIGRAIVLAELLSGLVEVDLIGFGRRAWPPIVDNRSIRLLAPPSTTAGLPFAARTLAGAIARADAIYAVKPRILSYGLAAMVRGNRPLLLDIDDLEHRFVKRRWGGLRQLVEPDREPVTRLLERWRPNGVTLTVASRALQRQFGGSWIPHVRDRSGYSEQAVARRQATRRRLGIADCFTIGFAGTARAHKGLLTAAEAVARMSPESRLLVAGSGHDSSDADTLRATAAGRAVIIGPFPMADLPGILGACDVVVVPQSRQPESVYQSPAKLMDAMAAGRAIVASDIGDAREILGDAGILVPPDDEAALRQALTDLRDAPRRTALADRARRAYEQRFDLVSWRRTMSEVLERACTAMEPR